MLLLNMNRFVLLLICFSSLLLAHNIRSVNKFRLLHVADMFFTCVAGTQYSICKQFQIVACC